MELHDQILKIKESVKTQGSSQTVAYFAVSSQLYLDFENLKSVCQTGFNQLMKTVENVDDFNNCSTRSGSQKLCFSATKQAGCSYLGFQ